MKKWISVILTIAMLSSMLAGFEVAVSAASANEVSVDGAEMTWVDFAEKASTDYLKSSVRLLADITVVDRRSIADFQGVLDGCGHSISGLSAPLFTKLTNAEVKNLTLNGNITTPVADCGALAGLSAGTLTVENVTSNVDVTVIPTTTIYVSGLIGRVTGTSTVLKNVVNQGDIVVGDGNTNLAVYAGGLIGQAKSSAANELVITSCINNGNVYANVIATALLGGIAGHLCTVTTMTGCINNGEIKTNPSKIHGGHKCGGIAGVTEIAGTVFTFHSCVNTGAVSGGRWAGGILGSANTMLVMRNCYNYGTIAAGVRENTVAADAVAGGIIASLGSKDFTTVFDACVNSGAITAVQNGTNTQVNAGGIIGWFWNGAAVSMTDCVSNGSVQSQKYSGGVVGWVNCSTALESHIDKIYVNGSVELLEDALSGAFAGAAAGYVTAGKLAFTNAAYSEEIEHPSCNGTTTNISGTMSKVSSAAEWVAGINEIVQYKGYQKKATADNTDCMDLRLVVELNAADAETLAAYRNLGYEMYLIAENTVGQAVAPTKAVKETTTVYTSLKAYNGEGTLAEPITPADGRTLAAVVVSGIPKTGTYTLIMRPYVTAAGEAASVTYGTGTVIVIEDGVITAHHAL